MNESLKGSLCHDQGLRLTVPGHDGALPGQGKYEDLIDCKSRGIYTQTAIPRTSHPLLTQATVVSQFTSIAVVLTQAHTQRVCSQSNRPYKIPNYNYEKKEHAEVAKSKTSESKKQNESYIKGEKEKGKSVVTKGNARCITSIPVVGCYYTLHHYRRDHQPNSFHLGSVQGTSLDLHALAQVGTPQNCSHYLNFLVDPPAASYRRRTRYHYAKEDMTCREIHTRPAADGKSELTASVD